MLKMAWNWTAVQLRALKSEEKGQGMVEYALIIAFIAIVVIAALVLLGPAIARLFTNITGELDKATTAAPTGN